MTPTFGSDRVWHSGFKLGLAVKIKNHLETFKSDCIFRRPGNWNVDSIRQTLDSADLIVSPGCNSSRNGSSGFSSGRDEWIPVFQIPGYLLGYLRNFGSIQILGYLNFF